jgi:uncharacterized membrane protein YoaT (DUF817 family)
MRRMHRDLALDPKNFQRPILGGQLLLTAAILAWVPGNAIKLAIMLLVWAIVFRRLTRAELTLMIGTNAIFIPMDIATLHQGAFRFTAPNLLGLPYYEFLMWGFYVLNAIRFLGAKPPQAGSIILAIGLVVLFALPFSLIKDYRLLFLVSAVLLAINIGFFHERRDIAFVGYMIAVGAVIEYAGVRSGQWTYDGPTVGGVPLWFATMWGGVGLFIHRLWLPLLRWLNGSKGVDCLDPKSAQR